MGDGEIQLSGYEHWAQQWHNPAMRCGVQYSWSWEIIDMTWWVGASIPNMAKLLDNVSILAGSWNVTCIVDNISIWYYRSKVPRIVISKETFVKYIFENSTHRKKAIRNYKGLGSFVKQIHPWINFVWNISGYKRSEKSWWQKTRY